MIKEGDIVICVKKIKDSNIIVGELYTVAMEIVKISSGDHICVWEDGVDVLWNYYPIESFMSITEYRSKVIEDILE